jgi:hypothetical protein
MKSMLRGICYAVTALVLIFLTALYGRTAISQVAGLAVAGSPTQWNNLKDGVQGDGLSNGVGAFAVYGYNGTTFDRLRSSIANGITVDVSRLPTPIAITTDTSGAGFFAVKRADITTASVNLALGFTSKKIALRTPATNTDDICVDYAGGTAACPAANTAGNERLPAGSTLILDSFAVASISVIAASGTQTFSVTGWH